MAILTESNYVDKAESVVGKLNKGRNGEYYLTTTQIRNLLALTSALYDEAQIRDFSELQDKISYLRVQFVYQAGREPAVRDFVEKAEIREILKEINDTESLIRFCRYMEALVAYFRFKGGSDS